MTPTPLHCADFEDGNVQVMGATLELIEAPAPIVDTTERASGNASLLARIPAASPQSYARVAKTYELPGGRTSFELVASVRLDLAAPGTGSYTEQLGLTYESAATRYRLVLWQDDEAWGLTNFLDTTPTRLASGVTQTGEWHRVRLVGTFGGRVKIFVDGVEKEDAALPDTSGPVVRVGLRYGNYYSDATDTAKSVRVDDVALWVD